MNIRTTTINDLEEISQVESICFPAEEAATKEIFENRLKHYGNHFLLMFDDDKLVAFINGLVTNESNLKDELYENGNLHDENGDWQMIFGVNTIPSYRNKGLAGKLITEFINNAKNENRKGLVLTCKETLVPYYSKFGFIDEGISEDSTHGGVVWNQMRLTF